MFLLSVIIFLFLIMLKKNIFLKIRSALLLWNVRSSVQKEQIAWFESKRSLSIFFHVRLIS